MQSNFEKAAPEDGGKRSLASRMLGRAARLIGTGMLLGALALPFLASPSDAHAETRSLKLYFVHTGEKAVITFKRNGVYDRQGLQQLNRFLRDWRRNQPTKMDPRLFDLIWEVYQRSGSNTYINVVCGFRSPETNAMLRSRSKMVAEKSQHILGKAMDFFIPDVKLTKLREIGMKLQVGGVGFYPHSGSPFVHMDVGGVRAWPRMSRSELVRLFPNGHTLHLPADGNPLPGYEEAKADYLRRVGSNHIEIADTGGSGKKKGFFAALFGGGEDDDESAAPAETAVASAEPAPKAKEQVLTNPTQPILAAAGEEPQVAINAPIPLGRPSLGNQVGNSGVAAALVEPQANSASAALAAASGADTPADGEYPDLQAYNIPVPTLLGKRGQPGEAEMETAALGVPDKSSELADVPVPVSRPSAAEALLAKADVSGDADQQAALSPAAAAALDKGAAPADKAAIAIIPEAAPVPADDQAAIASADPSKEPYSTDEGEDEEEVAALDGQPDAGAPNFAEIFDQQQQLTAAPAPDMPIAKGQPAVGGRPTSKEAAIAAQGMGKALTGEMLAKWAIGNALVTKGADKVKAPRFVSLAMRAQPAAPVTGGFSKAADIDPGRFN